LSLSVKQSDLILKENKYKIVIYGGNGFVGTHIAERLSQEDVCIVCVSRSGHKPLHLKNQAWSKSVRWCAGDASNPEQSLLQDADCVIILVGSPPIPTFSQAAFKQSLHNNGIAPSQAINEAAKAGVKRIILMGAELPSLLDKGWFAYAKGKKMAIESAKKFVKHHPENAATVLQPSVISGKRYLTNGKSIPLNTLLFPLATLLPSKFICVEKIAEHVTNIITEQDDTKKGFRTVKYPDI